MELYLTGACRDKSLRRNALHSASLDAWDLHAQGVCLASLSMDGAISLPG